MTAGSWIYIGSQGIVQGTYETFVSMGKRHFGGDLRGRWILTAGLGGMGGAQPLAATMAGAQFVIASPPGYRLPEEMQLRAEERARAHGGAFRTVDSPQQAVAGADVVYTDVWTSMGQEDSYAQRTLAFEGFQVTPELMSRAKPDAIFMHDLPAHRGEETVDAVIGRLKGRIG